MSETPERHEFQTEVRQLLDLMIHSLYSHKEVFLRELISNASDALDKRRFEALTRPELAPADELAIHLEVDAAARTLTVSDNGIGMSRDEVVQNIGTIARSGTGEFLAALRERAGQVVPPELIGRFGVGFYSSFMVADRITVLSRRAGEAMATRWESGGDGYTIEEAERDAPGTSVTLHLKPGDAEDGLADYAQAPALRETVKKYSDFVAYPIRLGTDTLNSMKAIWTRPKDEVTEEEYREFYKHVSRDWNDPLEHLSIHVEGGLEARALLYIPSKAPFDLHDRDGGHRRDRGKAGRRCFRQGRGGGPRTPCRLCERARCGRGRSSPPHEAGAGRRGEARAQGLRYHERRDRDRDLHRVGRSDAGVAAQHRRDGDPLGRLCAVARVRVQRVAPDDHRAPASARAPRGSVRRGSSPA